MSEACPRETRVRADTALLSLQRREDVLGVDVLDPNEGPRAEWTIEATIEGDRVPAAVVAVLASHDCGIISTTLRAPDLQQLVVSV
jgi:hypothetical protein